MLLNTTNISHVLYLPTNKKLPLKEKQATFGGPNP